MSFRLLLKEQSDRDFLSKYKNKFSSEILTTIMQWFDPEDLMWVGKNLDAGASEEDVKELLLLVRNFKRLQGVIQTPELELFDSPVTLAKQIKTLQDSMLNGLQEREDYNSLIDNSNILLLEPKKKEIVCKYFPKSEYCQPTVMFGLIADGKRAVFILYDKKTNQKFLFDFRPKTPVFTVESGDGKVFNSIESIESEYQIPSLNLYYDLMLYYLKSDSEYLDKIDLDIFFQQNRLKEIERNVKIKKQKILDEAENRRLQEQWKLDSDCPYVGILAHAVFQHLIGEGELTPADEEVETRRKQIVNRIEVLNQQYEDDQNVRYDLYDEINDLENELQDISDEYSDVYDIVPLGSEHYGLSIFGCDKISDEYAVGDQDDVESATKQYWENYINSEGVNTFSDSTLEEAVDEELIISYFEDFYNDDLYSDPENYFDDGQKELSYEQQQKIERARYNISKFSNKMEKMYDLLERTPEGANYDSLEKRINDLDEFIKDSKSFVEEVEENPEGEFPSELYDAKLEELIDDVKYDPIQKLRDWDMELERFIDEEKLIEILVESDGTEVLAFNDGRVNEEKVLSNWYYIIKV